MSVASFLTLSRQPANLAAEPLIERLCADWGIERESVQIAPPEHRQGFQEMFVIGNYVVAISVREAPVGAESFGQDARRSPFWPEGQPLPQPSHFVTVAIRDVAPDEQQPEFERLGTEMFILGGVTSELVRMLPEVLSVGFNNGNQLVAPSYFEDFHRDTEVRLFTYAVQIIVEPTEGGFAGFTRGMPLYGLPELELTWSPQEGQETASTLYGVARYLQQSGPVLKPGETLSSPDPKLPPLLVVDATPLPAGRGEVLRLAFANEPVAPASSSSAAETPASTSSAAGTPVPALRQAQDPPVEGQDPPAEGPTDSVQTAVLMRRPDASVLSSDALIGQLERDWPELGGTIHDVEQQDDMITLSVGERAVVIRLNAGTMDEPLDEFVGASRLWAPDVPVPTDATQLAMVAIAREVDGVAPLHSEAVEDASLLTRIVASVIAIDQATRAVFMRGAGHIVSPRLYREFAQATLPEPPALLWVSINVGSEEGDGYGFTRGLGDLELPDLEVLPGSGMDSKAVLETLTNTATYLVVAGPVIGDGDTLGDAETANLVARIQPSSFGFDDEVLAIVPVSTQPAQ